MLPPEMGLESPVAYNPYAALLVGFDIDGNAMVSGQATPPDEFAQHCKQLREGLRIEADRFPCIDGGEKFGTELHRPLILTSLGATDSVALTLLDNFMGGVRLTSIARGVVRSDLYLCPNVETIPVSANSTELPFATFEHDCNERLWPFVNPCSVFAVARDEASVVTPPTPLCVLSSFKLGSLSSVPHGVLMQTAVFTTVVNTVRQTLSELHDVACKSGTDDLTPCDIRSTKCLLLEPLGADDLCIAVFTTNFSVSSAIVRSLRSLELGDIPRHAPDAFERAIGKSRLHSLVVNQSARRLSGDAKCDAVGPKRICGNHVFMQSYSTLCYSQEAAEAGFTGVSGACQADFQVDVHSGHEAEIAQQFQRARAAWQPEDENGSESEESVAEDRPGLYDISLKIGYGTYEPTSSVLQLLHQFTKQLRYAPTSDGHCAESSFSHLATQLWIPLPRMEAEHTPLWQRRVNWSSHSFGKVFFAEIRNCVERQFGLSDPLTFREMLRRRGCPPSLQYGLMHLFQEFTECLGDPRRFDAVIDLYDAFAALSWAVSDDGPVAKWLQQSRSGWQRKRMVYEAFFDGPLSRFLDSLANAFVLRADTAMTRHGIRDSVFTLRFGAAKLIAASDVVLKCSIGLARAVLSERAAVENLSGLPGQSMKEQLRFRQRYGSIVSISNHLDATATPLVWRSESNSAMISIEMDLFHLFMPEQGYLFFHEVAHLLLNAPTIRQGGLLQLSRRDKSTASETAWSRTEEVFADLLASMFIFREKPKLFSRFHVLTFSVISGRVIGVDLDEEDAEYESCLLEVLTRGFLVSELLDVVLGKMPKEGMPVVSDHAADRQITERFSDSEKVTRRFYQYIMNLKEELRGVTPWFETSVNGLDARQEGLVNGIARDCCERQFVKALCVITNKAVHAWNVYWREVPTGRMVMNKSTEGIEIGDSIRNCLQRGSAFLRANWDEAAKADDRDEGLECLYVVCNLIREYIRFLLENTSGRIYVGGEHEPDTFAPADTFSPLLIHESRVPFYAVDPRMRQRKMLAQIGYYKTLFDVSSQLRSRRVVDLAMLSEENK
ncbi:MAG: hypothetical protein R3C18_15980 [Planctomycetaceae bacterium]